MMPLKVQSLAVSFPGLATPVLSIANLEIAAGSRVALTGGSGSGKSTLLNIIAGLERVGSGHVVWAGRISPDCRKAGETAGGPKMWAS